MELKFIGTIQRLFIFDDVCGKKNIEEVGKKKNWYKGVASAREALSNACSNYVYHSFGENDFFAEECSNNKKTHLFGYSDLNIDLTRK